MFTRYIPKYKQTTLRIHASRLMYEVSCLSSLQVSLRVFPFYSHHCSLSLSLDLFSLQSAVIFSCRSYFRRAHPSSSLEAALRIALCALSKGPSCSLAGSSNWISRLARRSQSNHSCFPRFSLPSLISQTL